MHQTIRTAVAVAAVTALAACAAPAEQKAATPPPTVAIGTIPPTQVYVSVTTADGSAALSVPQDWARTAGGSSLLFTSGFDSVAIDTATAPTAPTVAAATAEVVPLLEATNDGFVLGSVQQVGPAIVVTYLARSTPAPDTGPPVTLAVARYEFWHAKHDLVLTLSSPQGADNTAAWQKIVDSLHWLR